MELTISSFAPWTDACRTGGAWIHPSCFHQHSIHPVTSFIHSNSSFCFLIHETIRSVRRWRFSTSFRKNHLIPPHQILCSCFQSGCFSCCVSVLLRPSVSEVRGGDSALHGGGRWRSKWGKPFRLHHRALNYIHTEPNGAFFVPGFIIKTSNFMSRAGLHHLHGPAVQSVQLRDAVLLRGGRTEHRARRRGEIHQMWPHPAHALHAGHVQQRNQGTGPRAAAPSHFVLSWTRRFREFCLKQELCRPANVFWPWGGSTSWSKMKNLQLFRFIEGPRM